MPTCKECEWFIHFESGKGVCCCPDCPKDNLPEFFPYMPVTMETISCKFFSKEVEEMFENTEKEKVIKESKIMSALEEHNYILDDVQDFVNQLFQKFKPVLEEDVFEYLEQVDKKLANKSDPISAIPLVRTIHQLSDKLIKIAEYLQALSRHTDF